MKTTLMSTLLVAPLALPASAMAANADTPDPLAGTNYWGLHLGQNNIRELNARVDFGAGDSFPGKADASKGLHGGLVVGRRTEHARFELEVETGRFDVKRLTLDPMSADVDARGTYLAAFANAYRTERLTEKVDVFAGAGIGVGRVKLPRLGLGDACDCFGPASKSGFAWQVRAGAAYRVTEQSSLGLQYTALRLPAPEAGGPPGVRYDRKTFGAWSVSFTRRF